MNTQAAVSHLMPAAGLTARASAAAFANSRVGNGGIFDPRERGVPPPRKISRCPSERAISRPGFLYIGWMFGAVRERKE
jgi:hypothetical protein